MTTTTPDQPPEPTAEPPTGTPPQDWGQTGEPDPTPDPEVTRTEDEPPVEIPTVEAG